VTGGTALTAGSAAVLSYLGMINVVVLVFNMIPAFPLDGGRVLRGVLWAATGSYLKGTRIAGAVGIAFSYLLFLGGFLMILNGNVFNGVWFFFLSMFLQNAAQSSVAYAQLQQLLHGVTVADLMCPDPLTVPAETPLHEVVQGYFLKHPYKAYPVLEDGKFLGMLTLKSVQDVGPERWASVPAREAAVRQTMVLTPRVPAVQALQTLAASGHSRLPVLDAGELVGLLCLRDIMDFIEIRTGLSLAPAEMAWTGDGPAATEALVPGSGQPPARV
jgi:CBS domain-containing protein